MIIKITPMGAPRQTQRDVWKRRPVIVRYHAYRDQLNLMLPGYELGMSVNLIFRIAMPKSYSKKKRDELRGTYHDQKPDADNLAKGFMDAFHQEDKHVAILHVEKYWADEGSIEIL
jgi:Holliday junction resolvase RusA-like endonuclease